MRGCKALQWKRCCTWRALRTPLCARKRHCCCGLRSRRSGSAFLAGKLSSAVLFAVIVCRVQDRPGPQHCMDADKWHSRGAGVVSGKTLNQDKLQTCNSVQAVSTGGSHPSVWGGQG